MKWFYSSFGWAAGLMLSLLWGSVGPVLAQIKADDTLGGERSSVDSTSLDDRAVEVIRGGARRGANLFHSFSTFNVRRGQRVYFANPSGVDRILSRVTGTTPSQIRGTLGVLGNADLFLLNPNGIIFGREALLNVNGSFVATTATRIAFADGTQFSAIPRQSSPLLTVSVPTGLQFGRNPGEIVNFSSQPAVDLLGNRRFDSFGHPIYGLSVPADRTLALVGGDVTLQTGARLFAESGRIEIGSVAGAGRVDLTAVTSGWGLSYGAIEPLGTVRLLSSSLIDTSGRGGGAIRIHGGQVSLNGTDGIAQIYSFTRGDQAGEPIEVIADRFTVVGDRTSLRTVTEGTGRAGDVIISTEQLEIRDGGRIGSISAGRGAAGGNVRVRAAEAITLAGVSAEGSLSLLYALALAEGAAGQVSIQTDRLQILAGGHISSTTFGRGPAGDITIHASDVELADIALDAAGQPIQVGFDGGSTVPYSSGLFAGTAPDSSGDGGRLRLFTDRLRLRDGTLLQANTFGSGRAGNIEIYARDSIEVGGTSGPFRTAIAASSGGLPNVGSAQVSDAIGRGGNVTIATETLTIRDGAVVAVNSRNPEAGGAGRLRVQAETIRLENQGQLNAETESGNRASIQLAPIRLLLLRQNSEVSTRAGRQQGGGDAGNIDIAADFVVAGPSENSDITADAGRGAGGNIDLRRASAILGLGEREQRSPNRSDITASSQAGLNGEIVIDAPQIDPTQGLFQLPSDVVDASRLVLQHCPTGPEQLAATSNQFVITGRGGVPPSPADVGSSETVLADWARLAEEDREIGRSLPSRVQALSTAALARASAQITEAQGWIVDADGRVTLIAAANPMQLVSAIQGTCDRS